VGEVPEAAVATVSRIVLKLIDNETENAVMFHRWVW